jgi:hypothetical protein
MSAGLVSLLLNAKGVFLKHVVVGIHITIEGIGSINIDIFAA